MIQRKNTSEGKQIPLFRKEELLARILTTFESFNETFQKQGFTPFLPLYYKRWLHR